MRPVMSSRLPFLSRLASLAVALCAAGCFSESPLPECETLADCPVNQGYNACIDGWCYRTQACADRPVVAGDGCCALTEGDRSEDTDCMLADLALSCRDPAGPSVDNDGNIYVTCLMPLTDGTRNVVLRRLDTSGNLSVPLVAGIGTVAFSPVMGKGSTVMVQFGAGLARFSTVNLGDAGGQSTGPAAARVASNGGSDAFRGIGGWPTLDGKVVLIDEEKNILLSYGLPRPDLGAGGAWPPTVSWTGKRMYVTWKAGVLDVVESGSNPLGTLISMNLPAVPSGAAIDVDGRIYVPLSDGTLRRYQETTSVRLQEVWSTVIFGGVGQQAVNLLVDDEGLIIAVSGTGDVQVVKDMEGFGSVVATGSFGTPLAPLHPVLGDSGRVVASSAAGRIVSVLVDSVSGLVIQGLGFNVPSPPASDMLLLEDVLMYVSETGSLMSWSYPAGPAGRWSRSGANQGSTGRTARPALLSVKP